jgi:hypothetical protein
MGLFALVDIPKGKAIGIYSGEYINTSDQQENVQ